MVDPADHFATAEELNQRLAETLAAHEGVTSPEGWPENIPFKPIDHGQIKISVMQEDGTTQDFGLWLEKGPDGNFDQFTLVSHEQLMDLYQEVGMPLIDRVAKNKDGKYITNEDGEVVYQHTLATLSPEERAVYDLFAHDGIRDSGKGEFSEAIGNTAKEKPSISVTPDALGNSDKISISPDAVEPEIVEPPKPPETKPEEKPDVVAEEPVTEPGEVAPFAHTALAVDNLVALAELDFSAQMGGVAKASATSDEALDQVRGAWRQANKTMNEIRGDFMDYYKTEDAAARQAIEQDIIAKVDALPDGYKGVAIAFVRDTLEREAPLAADAYKKQVKRLYNDDENILEAQRKLYPDKYPPPEAEAAPETEPPETTIEFEAAAVPTQDELVAMGAVLPKVIDVSGTAMPDYEREKILEQTAREVMNGVRHGRIPVEMMEPLIEQFKPHEDGLSENLQYSKILERFRDNPGSNEPSRDLNAAAYERRTGAIETQRLESIAESQARVAAAMARVQDALDQAQEFTQTLVENPHIPDHVKETLTAGRDPAQAREIFGDDLDQAELLKATGFAPVGDEPMTIKIGDEGTFALWQSVDANGDMDYVLQNPHELRTTWFEAFNDKTAELNGQGERFNLAGFQAFGSWSRAIDEATEKIDTGKPDYDLDTMKLEDLDPAMRSAVMRHQGLEEQAEAIEAQIKADAERTASAFAPS